MHSASIDGVGTLYVRDVPEQTLRLLRARARSNGRSVNSEVLEILDEVTGREDAELIAQRLEALAARIGLPADAPRVEDLIREQSRGIQERSIGFDGSIGGLTASRRTSSGPRLPMRSGVSFSHTRCGAAMRARHCSSY